MIPHLPMVTKDNRLPFDMERSSWIPLRHGMEPGTKFIATGIDRLMEAGSLVVLQGSSFNWGYTATVYSPGGRSVYTTVVHYTREVVPVLVYERTLLKQRREDRKAYVEAYNKEQAELNNPHRYAYKRDFDYEGAGWY